MITATLVRAPWIRTLNSSPRTPGTDPSFSLPAPAKPFIKWVGGKRSIIGELLARLPAGYTEYHEPFVGGGALFFAAQPRNGHISDVNLHLVLGYRAIRDNLDELLDWLRRHERRHNKAYYLRARKRVSRATDPVEVASLFIYLNRTCYNGLYRVNRMGEFNVPMGDYASPTIADEGTLRAASLALRGTTIEQGDFARLRPRKGAFYYLDPPYHETYDGYNGAGFNDARHEELAAFCRRVDATGGKFLLSNSDTEFVRELYAGFHIEKIDASRSVSCKAHQRGKETELLIRNYALN